MQLGCARVRGREPQGWFQDILAFAKSQESLPNPRPPCQPPVALQEQLLLLCHLLRGPWVVLCKQQAFSKYWAVVARYLGTQAGWLYFGGTGLLLRLGMAVTLAHLFTIAQPLPCNWYGDFTRDNVVGIGGQVCSEQSKTRDEGRKRPGGPDTRKQACWAARGRQEMEVQVKFTSILESTIFFNRKIRKLLEDGF